MGRKLFALASVMTANHKTQIGDDSEIPAAYTYFGQFIDHDITLEEISVDGENLPLSLQPLVDPTRYLANARTAALDLDSVYSSPAPREVGDDSKMRLGTVATAPPRPSGKDQWNDLPRQGRSHDIRNDRAALIGDPRNDENLIVAQLHVAFLRAHNALVDEGASHAEARLRLQTMYQSAIFGDLLPQLVDVTVLEDVLDRGPRYWRPSRSEPFVPLEFAVAAFRFGHSMVRQEYDINESFGLAGRLGKAPLAAMFTFTAMSGSFSSLAGQDFDTLPENWLIEWHRLLQVPSMPHPVMARRIDTTLSSGLDDLRGLEGERLPEPVAVRLAARNLLRGYRLGLPTGQAVARIMDSKPLAGVELLEALPEAQRKLVEALGFHEITPLWFYILAEAGDMRAGKPNGKRLGKVGSTIVVETLYNLARWSSGSIFNEDGTKPKLHWTLLDILRKGAVA
ncbi:peroxidase family protein [Mesorhizobium sp. ES1-6]|uniref:peroxidase family protein n=1 Tax=Mesorhizobium sp. ES1-6 TaxID=2876626 RepID=UPI001CCB3765|nr:peroxidase family protein [Mesorhizobium sp. ES1-6]MBZ9803460.1 hypothetical protein [Mesorhizobium sp. ES1-6]